MRLDAPLGDGDIGLEPLAEQHRAAGALFMGDRIGASGLFGCALILACVLMVQLQPIVWRWFADNRTRTA